MAERMSLDSIEVWREDLCAQGREAQCLDMGCGFKLNVSVRHAGEAQLSRISGTAQHWKKVEKHLQTSEQESIIFHLQLSGASIQIQDNRRVALRPGDLVCTDSTRPLEAQLFGEFAQLLVHAPRSLIVSSFGPTERFTCQDLKRATPVGLMLASFLTSIDAVLDDVSDQAAENLSMIAISLINATLADTIAATVDRASWTKQATLYRAQNFIQQNFRNPDLTPTMVATGLKLSVRYLQTLFRDLGKTPSDYLWECRLKGGKRDLENPALRGLSISEIAWRNGFVDLSHFSSRFRQMYGITPRIVRMQTSAISPHGRRRTTDDDPIRLYKS